MMADMFFIDTGNVVMESSDKKSKKSKGKNKKSKTMTLEGSEVAEQCEFQFVSNTNILGEESVPVEEEVEEDDRPKGRRPQFRRSANKRYHENTDSDVKVGVLSDALRAAMGMHRGEVPFFIYRMRQFGYPPGWLKSHEREKSGLSIVGEEAAEEEKVEYDVDKFLSIPGFNAPLPAGVTDDWRRLGALPMQKMHGLDVMRRSLANGGRREDVGDAESLSDRLDDNTETRDATESCGGGHKKRKKKKRRRQEEPEDANCDQEEEPDVSEAKNARLEHQDSENSVASESELTKLEEERRRILDQLNSTQAEEGEDEDKEDNDDEEEEEMEEDQEEEQEEEVEEEEEEDGTAMQGSNGIHAADDTDADAGALTLAASLGSPVCLTPNGARQLPDVSKFSVGIEEFRPFEDTPCGTYSKLMGALRDAKKKS